jgi:hypothetical protein
MSLEDSANLLNRFERILNGSTYYRHPSTEAPQLSHETTHADSAGL